MLDISDIQMIKAISEEGSINRACEVLNMSQPTLSKRLNRLEQKAKMELFYRHSNGMVPTDAAKYLMREGANLQMQMDLIERHLELMANLEGGEVRLGVGPIVEQLFLPKVALDFVELKVGFSISVITESSKKLIEMLKRGEIDIAIGPFDQSDTDDSLKFVLTSSENQILVARNGHALAKKESLVPKDLLDFPIICPTIPAHMKETLSQLSSGAPFNPTLISDNYTLAKTVVENSDYITGGPESLFRRELESGSFKKLAFPFTFKWQCYCVVKPETHLMPAIKHVVELFEQYMEPIR